MKHGDALGISGGGGGHVKNVGLQNRGDGPKDSL